MFLLSRDIFNIFCVSWQLLTELYTNYRTFYTGFLSFLRVNVMDLIHIASYCCIVMVSLKICIQAIFLFVLCESYLRSNLYIHTLVGGIDSV